MKQYTFALLTFFALVIGSTSGFAPLSHTAFNAASTMPAATDSSMNPQFHPALQRQRKSMAPIQTQSLFGLGAPELAIIAIAAAFLLGPQKLAELGKDAGKIAGELKEVPKEFQKGMAEGEMEANKALKADKVEDSEKKD